MPDYRVFSWLAVLIVLLAIGGDGRCQSDEPHATFLLKDGWVELALRQDGRPVANAMIQIMDENGVKFGEGETGEEGHTAFPLPPGSSFVVEIKAGDRTADPIRLFKIDAGVEPARVLLSYGLRPCCRSIKVRGDGMSVGEPITSPPAPSDEPMPWHLLIPLFAGLCFAVALMFVVWIRYAKMKVQG